MEVRVLWVLPEPDLEEGQGLPDVGLGQISVGEVLVHSPKVRTGHDAGLEMRTGLVEIAQPLEGDAQSIMNTGVAGTDLNELLKDPDNLGNRGVGGRRSCLLHDPQQPVERSHAGQVPLESPQALGERLFAAAGLDPDLERILAGLVLCRGSRGRDGGRARCGGR